MFMYYMYMYVVPVCGVVLKACEVCLAVWTGDVPQQARGQAQSGTASTAGNNNVLAPIRSPTLSCTLTRLFVHADL